MCVYSTTTAVKEIDLITDLEVVWEIRLQLSNEQLVLSCFTQRHTGWLKEGDTTLEDAPDLCKHQQECGVL